MSTEIKIKVDSELEKLKQELEAIGSKDFNFIARRALNTTAERTLKHLQNEIPKYIDRPVPFTIRSLFVRGAKKSGPLEASIEWRSFAKGSFGSGRALAPNIEGGDRRQKGFEKALSAFRYLPSGWHAIPTKEVKKDAFGNVPGKYYTQLLSYLSADRSGTQNRPSSPTNGRQRKRQAKRVSKFFVVLYGQVVGSPPQSGVRRLSDGIYERVTTGFGQAYRQIFFFAQALDYKPVFPAYDVVNKYTSQVFPIEIENAIDLAIKTRQKFND